MRSWLLRFKTIINLRRLGNFQCAPVYLDVRWTYGGVAQSQSGLLLDVDATIIITHFGISLYHRNGIAKSYLQYTMLWKNSCPLKFYCSHATECPLAMHSMFAKEWCVSTIIH